MYRSQVVQLLFQRRIMLVPGQVLCFRRQPGGIANDPFQDSRDGLVEIPLVCLAGGVLVLVGFSDLALQTHIDGAGEVRYRVRYAVGLAGEEEDDAFQQFYLRGHVSHLYPAFSWKHRLRASSRILCSIQ